MFAIRGFSRPIGRCNSNVVPFSVLPIKRRLPPWRCAASRDSVRPKPLDPAWSWTREVPDHWNLDGRPGWLRIITQRGDMPPQIDPHDGSGPYYANNIVLRDAPAGNLDFRVRVLFDPANDYQQAGILIYASDLAFIKLVRVSSGYDQRVLMGIASNAWGDFREDYIPFSATSTSLAPRCFLIPRPTAGLPRMRAMRRTSFTRSPGRARTSACRMCAYSPGCCVRALPGAMQATDGCCGATNGRARKIYWRCA